MGRHQETTADSIMRHVDEAARLMGVSDQTVWRLVYAGKIKSVKIAGRRLIPRSEIARITGEVC